MKKIEDIRVNGSSDGSPIGTMGLNLGYLFLKHMGDYSMMEGKVNILGIDVHLKENIDNIPKISFNKDRTYNIFYMHLSLNKHFFETLLPFPKLEFLCKCVYQVLLEWAKKFSLPQEPITLAYEKIIDSEYFVERNKKYKSKNRKYTCWIEYRNEYYFRTYRLVFQNNKSDEISRYFICEKAYFKDDELMQTDYLKWLNSPRDLKTTGWIDNENFEMYWGEEKYIFNTETQTIEYKK